MKYSK
jgi:MFS family permease